METLRNFASSFSQQAQSISTVSVSTVHSSPKKNGRWEEDSPDGSPSPMSKTSNSALKRRESKGRFNKEWIMLDMLEQGVSSLYNPSIYEVKRAQGDRLDRHFIFREKKQHSYYLYSGLDFQDKDHRFLLMARFFPSLNEFRIYTTNAHTAPSMFNEEAHVAVVYWNRKKKMFVVKNKYCLQCSKTSQYFCESCKLWYFQQELGYYFIRDEDIAPKVHLKYTFAYICLPAVDKDFRVEAWCPAYVKRHEHREFSPYDGKKTEMHHILNNDQFRGSLRLAYHNDQDNANKKDDRLFLRAKKPFFKQVDRSLSLNFHGRAKKASRKNIQIEMKFIKGEQKKVVLLHGKLTDDVSSLDFGYPFSTLQAFCFSLGLYYYKKSPETLIK